MGLTDKDIEDAMKKMDGVESPDSLQLAPEFSKAIFTTIYICETLGGTLEVVNGDKRYKLTLETPAATN